MIPNDSERENRALEALVAASLLRAQDAEEDDEPRDADVHLLSDAEHHQIEEQGRALLATVLDGAEDSPSSHEAPLAVPCAPELAGAFNRADEGAEVSEKARQEMDRLRAAADEERRKRKGSTCGQ